MYIDKISWQKKIIQELKVFLNIYTKIKHLD